MFRRQTWSGLGLISREGMLSCKQQPPHCLPPERYALATGLQSCLHDVKRRGLHGHEPTSDIRSRVGTSNILEGVQCPSIYSHYASYSIAPRQCYAAVMMVSVATKGKLAGLM